MSDIVRRLRTRHANDFGWAETEALMREAADEIERLRSVVGRQMAESRQQFDDAEQEIERLRGALKQARSNIDDFIVSPVTLAEIDAILAETEPE